MFMAMVDINNDGALGLDELESGLADCREVDSMVAGAGDQDKRKQLNDQLAGHVQASEPWGRQQEGGE